MTTLRFSVKGDNDLATINLILLTQEKKFCEFLDSKIAYVQGDVVNLVTFQFEDDTSGQPPKVINELILNEKGQEPLNKFWEGVMVVNNNLTVVEAGRAN